MDHPPHTPSPTDRPRRVLVVGAVTLNGGDAALLLALIDRLREAYGSDTEIAVADSLPEASRDRYRDIVFVPSVGAKKRSSRHRLIRAASERLRRPRFAAAARLLRAGAPTRVATRLVPVSERSAVMPYLWADVVVMTGGTSLVEHYPLRDRWIGLGLAVWLDRPLVLFTQSLGPFKARTNQGRMREIAGYSGLALLRDERSLGHLNDIGISGEQLVVSSDAAFGLTPPAGAARPANRCRRVAISVRHWPYSDQVQGRNTSEAYRSTLVELVAMLVREDAAKVTFLSTCQGDGRYWTDDSEEALEIASRLPSDVARHVRVDRSFHTPDQLLDELTGFDLVVATRMHMAILALVAGRPVLPIAYEFKTAELFERLGAGEVVVDLASIGPEMLDTCRSIVGRLPDYQSELAVAVAVERDMARSASGPMGRVGARPEVRAA